MLDPVPSAPVDLYPLQLQVQQRVRSSLTAGVPDEVPLPAESRGRDRGRGRGRARGGQGRGRKTAPAKYEDDDLDREDDEAMASLDEASEAGDEQKKSKVFKSPAAKAKTQVKKAAKKAGILD